MKTTVFLVSLVLIKHPAYNRDVFTNCLKSYLQKDFFIQVSKRITHGKWSAEIYCASSCFFWRTLYVVFDFFLSLYSSFQK